MRDGRISQTALKVGYSLVTLSKVDDWSDRLPDGLAETTERLLVASGATGFGPRLMRATDTGWMQRVHRVQDRFVGGLFEGFGHRKIFMQRQVEDAIDAGAGQVLVLGAGFDTLCLRLAPRHRDVSFVEVDHPATSTAKARGVSAEGQPANLSLVAADLGERALSKVLPAIDGWDETRSSVVVAEGLLQYLADDDVHDLFREIAVCVPSGSRVAFSHLIPNDRVGMKLALRLTGEPFLSTVRSEDLPVYLADTGWRITSDVDTDESHGVERYALAEKL